MPYSGPVRQDPPTGESPIWLFVSRCRVALPTCRADHQGYVPSLPMGIVGVVSMLLVASAHAFYLFTKRGTRSVHLLFAFGSVSDECRSSPSSQRDHR